MKRLLISLAAASALTAAVTPAVAQTYWGNTYDRSYSRDYNRDYNRNYNRGGYDRDYDRYGANYDQRARQLEWRIDRAQRSGEIGDRDAARLRLRIQHTLDIYARDRADGRLTPYEVQDLNLRFDQLDKTFALASRSDYRTYGYGYRH